MWGITSDKQNFKFILKFKEIHWQQHQCKMWQKSQFLKPKNWMLLCRSGHLINMLLSMCKKTSLLTQILSVHIPTPRKSSYHRLWGSAVLFKVPFHIFWRQEVTAKRGETGHDISVMSPPLAFPSNIFHKVLTCGVNKISGTSCKCSSVFLCVCHIGIPHLVM